VPPFIPDHLGYGFGIRELPWPNALRLWVGETSPANTAASEELLLETNIDDMNPQFYEPLSERLFAAGALDVWTTPVQMKRGRPGFVLSALARPHDEAAVAEAMLRETSSLGVRIAHLERRELERDWRTVEVDGEPVRVKVGRLDGKVVNLAPEHADCERAARIAGAPVKVVWARALAAAQEEE
jgi:uncharacterized protein (DUF111 family)